MATEEKTKGKEQEAPKTYNRDEIASFLNDVSVAVVDSSAPPLHTIIALNDMLRQPNALELFDDELKNQARDLWLKMKATGVQLNDPPLLFPEAAELPADSGEAN